MNYLLMRSILFVVIKLMFIQVVTAQVIINEVSSSNKNILQDNNGEYSDWIELYNYGSQDVNLENWTISDDINDLSKWHFPNVTISANASIGENATHKAASASISRTF